MLSKFYRNSRMLGDTVYTSSVRISQSCWKYELNDKGDSVYFIISPRDTIVVRFNSPMENYTHADIFKIKSVYSRLVHRLHARYPELRGFMDTTQV